MAYLLNTDVLSKIIRPEEETHPVIRWVRRTPNRDIFISVISIGELMDAATNYPTTHLFARHEYERQILEGLPIAFRNRIVGVDERIAREWGRLRYLCNGDGETLPTEESLLLATCRAEGFVYVGRRESYHEVSGVQVTNPYALISPAHLDHVVSNG